MKKVMVFIFTLFCGLLSLAGGIFLTGCGGSSKDSEKDANDLPLMLIATPVVSGWNGYQPNNSDSLETEIYAGIINQDPINLSWEFVYYSGTKTGDKIFLDSDVPIQRLTRPRISGYKFKGYYTDAGHQFFRDDGRYISLRAQSGQVDYYKLHAEYSPVYTITLNDDNTLSGGTTPSNESRDQDYVYVAGSSYTIYSDSYGESSITQIVTPTYADYEFLGYYTAKSGGSQVFDANGKYIPGVISGSSSTTLYAHFEKQMVVYTVTLDGNRYLNSSLVLATSPTNSYTKTVYRIINSDYPTYFWSRVNFGSDGTFLGGTLAGIIESLPKTNDGWEFEGYYTAPMGGGTKIVDASGNYDSVSTITSSMTLYANYTHIVYEFTLDNTLYIENGFTLNAENYWGVTRTIYFNNKSGFDWWCSDAAGTSSISYITIPIISGWKFQGYYTKPLGEGTQIIDATGNIHGYGSVSGDLVYYAHYTPIVTVNKEIYAANEAIPITQFYAYGYETSLSVTFENGILTLNGTTSSGFSLGWTRFKNSLVNGQYFGVGFELLSGTVSFASGNWASGFSYAAVDDDGNVGDSNSLPYIDSYFSDGYPSYNIREGMDSIKYSFFTYQTVTFTNAKYSLYFYTDIEMEVDNGYDAQDLDYESVYGYSLIGKTGFDFEGYATSYSLTHGYSGLTTEDMYISYSPINNTLNLSGRLEWNQVFGYADLPSNALVEGTEYTFSMTWTGGTMKNNVAVDYSTGFDLYLIADGLSSQKYVTSILIADLMRNTTVTKTFKITSEMAGGAAFKLSYFCNSYNGEYTTFDSCSFKIKLYESGTTIVDAVDYTFAQSTNNYNYAIICNLKSDHNYVITIGSVERTAGEQDTWGCVIYDWTTGTTTLADPMYFQFGSNISFSIKCPTSSCTDIRLLFYAGPCWATAGMGVTFTDITVREMSLTFGTIKPVALDGTATTFDGVDDYVVVPDYKNLKFKDKLFVSLEVYSDTWSSMTLTNCTFLSCTEGGGWAIFLIGGILKFEMYDSAYGAYRSMNYSATKVSGLFANGTWHTLAMSFDGKYFSIYVDGARYSQSAFTTGGSIAYSSDTAVPIVIGAEPNGSTSVNNFFSGKIRNVYIANRAVSDETLHYSLGARRLLVSDYYGGVELIPRFAPLSNNVTIYIRTSEDGQNYLNSLAGGTAKLDYIVSDGTDSTKTEGFVTQRIGVLYGNLVVRKYSYISITANTDKDKGYVFVGANTTGSPPKSVNKSGNASCYINKDMSIYIYFKKTSSNKLKYDKTEKYFYFEDGEYPQTYVGKDLNEKLNTGITANDDWDYAIRYCNGVANQYLYVYTWTEDGNRYVPLTASQTMEISLGGTNITFTSGNQYWFKVEPIRWRVSEYGVSSTAYPSDWAWGTYKSGFTAITDRALGFSSNSMNSPALKENTNVYTTGEIHWNWYNSGEHYFEYPEVIATIKYNQTATYQTQYFRPVGQQTIVSEGSNTAEYFRNPSEAELDACFDDLRAKPSQFVAFQMGVSDNQYITYLTRDAGTNLENMKAISTSGLTKNVWATSMFGYRFAMTFSEGVNEL